MQGIAAITANNGWAMAFTGACIVMSGLAVLSFVISQLHRIIALLEGKPKKSPDMPDAKEPETESQSPGITAAEYDVLNDLPAAARVYSTLTQELGETFPLAPVYRIFQKENLPHPHITIMALRDAGFLVPAGDGKYSWRNV